MPSGFQDPSCRVSNLFGRKRRGRIVLPALLLETNVQLNFERDYWQDLVEMELSIYYLM